MAVRHLKRYASWVQTVEGLHHVAIHIATFPQSESLEVIRHQRREEKKYTVIQNISFKKIHVLITHDIE